MAIEQAHWNQFLSELIPDKQDILADALQGSSAKICGMTLLIFLSKTNVSNRINESEYLELLLTHLRDYLELILNDETVAAAIRSLYMKPPSNAFDSL
ncbi:MAG: hypothetical protein PHG06_19800 [Parabacteroides sp.]|nr:hypothetical protein [Parabacteroides sp.]